MSIDSWLEPFPIKYSINSNCFCKESEEDVLLKDGFDIITDSKGVGKVEEEEQLISAPLDRINLHKLREEFFAEVTRRRFKILFLFVSFPLIFVVINASISSSFNSLEFRTFWTNLSYSLPALLSINREEEK